MEQILQMAKLQRKLEEAVNKLPIAGRELAEKERDYKIVLRQEALKLKDEGMTVTLTDKVIYGIPVVAEARFQRDVAESLYKTALEYINVKKLEVRVLQEQTSQDWGQAKRGV